VRSVTSWEGAWDCSKPGLSSLIAAINALSNEKSSGMVASRVRNIVSGVKELGDRLAAIEKRLKALEKELSSPRREDLVPVPPELPPDSMGLARIGKDEGLVSEQNKPMKIV
jgi:hypothetical protein